MMTWKKADCAAPFLPWHCQGRNATLNTFLSSPWNHSSSSTSESVHEARSSSPGSLRFLPTHPPGMEGNASNSRDAHMSQTCPPRKKYYLHSLNSQVILKSLQTTMVVSGFCWPGFDPWVGKIPWRRKWWPTPVLLPGTFHGLRSLVGYSPWGRKELDTTQRLHRVKLKGSHNTR